LKGPIIR